MRFLDDEGRRNFPVLFSNTCLRAWSILFSLKCYSHSFLALTLISKHVRSVRILLSVILRVNKKDLR